MARPAKLSPLITGLAIALFLCAYFLVHGTIASFTVTTVILLEDNARVVFLACPVITSMSLACFFAVTTRASFALRQGYIMYFKATLRTSRKCHTDHVA